MNRYRLTCVAAGWAFLLMGLSGCMTCYVTEMQEIPSTRVGTIAHKAYVAQDGSIAVWMYRQQRDPSADRGDMWVVYSPQAVARAIQAAATQPAGVPVETQSSLPRLVLHYPAKASSDCRAIPLKGQCPDAMEGVLPRGVESKLRCEWVDQRTGVWLDTFVAHVDDRDYLVELLIEDWKKESSIGDVLLGISKTLMYPPAIGLDAATLPCQLILACMLSQVHMG